MSVSNSHTATGIKRAFPDDSFLSKITFYNPGLVAVVRAPDLKIFFVNNSFEYHLGYSNTDLSVTDLSFSVLLEERQYDHLINQLNIVKDKIEARSSFVIYRLRNRQGVLTPYYLYASPIPDQDELRGDLFYILMLPDLSKWGMPFTSFDSKNLFMEQFKSENFGTFEWIIGTDKIFCSEGMYKIYEMENDSREINNFLAKEFIHPEDKVRVRNESKRALEGTVDLNTEYRIITAKQNIKTIHCLARAVKNNEGKPVKYAGSVRDITEQRKTEEDLKYKIDELYESNKELEEFAYIASHDLQEPLRKITTFSDMLTEKYKDVLKGDGATYLSRMVASAGNMRSLINDLLDFSRIAKTQQTFELVNLNALLKQVESDLELTIGETRTITRSTSLPVVRAIATQMKQLFTNIINNAIKFHKPDVRPVIVIETKSVTESEKKRYFLSADVSYCKIQFTDNGIGFEEEYAARIFQVFQRLHGKAEYPGSGIGLAICKKIMEHHNGVIYARNIPGTGARFVIILPTGVTNQTMDI